MSVDYRNPEHTPGEYNPPIAHYRHFQAPEDVNTTLKAMGKEGRVFIAITKSAGVKYIWWNKDDNIIEIYGPKNRLEDAEKRVKDRIRWIENKDKEEENTTTVNIPEELKDHIGSIIGKHGKVFKAIKHQSAIRDISCDTENLQINITGPKHCLNDAIKRVSERIQQCKNTIDEQ